jgi:hypothetical protein
MVVDPVTAGVAIKTGAEVVKSVSDAVGKVSELLSKGLDVYQFKVSAADRAQVRDEDRKDHDRRLELERQHARELYIRSAADRRAEIAQSARAAGFLEAQRFLHKRYPVEDGPGSLRNGVRLLTSESGTAPPLVLFTVPRHTDPFWQYLLWRTQSALDVLENAGHAHIRQTNRPVTWPHDELIKNDLLELAALVVSVEVVTEKLQIRMGGYNLGGRLVRPMSSVVSTYLPEWEYFTTTRLEAFEATAGDGFHRPVASHDPEGLRRLQMEWATRIAAVAVVAAVDAYYLLRTSGYREHIDEALERLDPAMPAPTSLPLKADVLADPGYHMLHHARRLQAHGQTTKARQCLADAIRALAQAPNASLAQAARQARADNRLRDWHIELIREIKALLPAKVVAVLLEPAPDDAPRLLSTEPDQIGPLNDRARTGSESPTSRPIRRTAQHGTEDEIQRPVGRHIRRTNAAHTPERGS